jgi:hypothetical protein
MRIRRALKTSCFCCPVPVLLLPFIFERKFARRRDEKLPAGSALISESQDLESFPLRRRVSPRRERKTADASKRTVDDGDDDLSVTHFPMLVKAAGEESEEMKSENPHNRLAVVVLSIARGKSESASSDGVGFGAISRGEREPTN